MVIRLENNGYNTDKYWSSLLRVKLGLVDSEGGKNKSSLVSFCIKNPLGALIFLFMSKVHHFVKSLYESKHATMKHLLRVKCTS